jgi:outer membrane protein assembly factor BamE (lipoprotein component of BamABCDE complex)
MFSDPIKSTDKSLQHGFKRVVTGVAIASAIVLGLAACTPTEQVRGYVPTAETINKLKNGVDNKRKVVRLVGSPTSVSTFESNTWYYISRHTQQLAFFEEEVLDQKVVAIDFDKGGFISDVRRYALDDARNIVPIDHKTVSSGREMGVLEQLFGNIGRFSNDGDKAASE